MKLVSFNVNGIRGSVGKGLHETIKQINADIICFQETKATPEQVAEALKDANGYHVSAYGAVKLGYSGTAIASKEKPAAVDFGIGMKGHDDEGRVVTATFKDDAAPVSYPPLRAHATVLDLVCRPLLDKKHKKKKKRTDPTRRTNTTPSE